ncbi:MAG: ABC transporter permease [Treponema sp.]|jgi:simple sugar transport system permease protein|nr:ABC transporter permease [Treponema sp.]
MDLRFPLLHSAVTIMTPLLLAASGGLFTELAGMLNIALEGLLLTGAFAAIVCAHFSGSILWGILGAICASLLLSAILGFVTLRLRANVFIAGLAANLFASGLTVVLSFRLFGTRGVKVFDNIPPLKTVILPIIDRIPLAGDLLSGHSRFVYLGWALLLAGHIVLCRTPFGFRLRACEGHSQALVSMGLKPGAYRFAAFLISGLSCGIGGAFLSLNLGAFVPNISSGKGWIALVVIFLGNRRPLGILAAALVFGLAEAFSNYAQGSLNVPADFILAIPYLFTLILMTMVSVFSGKDGRGRE